MEDIVLDREYKSSLRCLKIGDKVAELPIIQGGISEKDWWGSLWKEDCIWGVSK